MLITRIYQSEEVDYLENKKYSEEQIRKQIYQVSEELNQLNTQFQYISQQINLINSIHQDMNSTLKSLKELGKRKVGEKILIPMSSRIFLPVMITEETISDIFINLGSNIVKKGDVTDGIEHLEHKLEQTKKAMESLQGEYSNLEREITARENFLSQYYR